MISVMDFGAVADATRDSTTGLVSGTDNTAAFQDAIDAARAAGETLFIPAGRYRIDDTLFLGSASGFYDQQIVHGEGYALRGEVDGTTLYFTKADRLGIAVQGARGVRIRQLSLIGPNLHYAANNNLCTSNALAADLTHENMIDPAILTANPHMLKQFSVNAAVATDPFMGSAPTLAMPGGTYGVSFNSDDVVLEDCYIGGWAAAMALQPCNVSSQSDYSGYRDCYVEACVWGLTVGTSQARNTIWSNNKHVHVHTCITNKVHGQRIGLLHGDLSNSMTFGSIQFFDINTQFSGPVTFRDCYSEDLCRLGNLRVGGGGAFPVTFSGCYWYFSLDDSVHGRPIAILAKSRRGQVSFEGCEFALGSYEVLLFEGNASDYRFANCRTHNVASDNLDYRPEWAAHNFLANVCFVPSVSDSNRPSAFDVNHLDALELGAGEPVGGLGGRILPDYSVCSRTMNLCAWPGKARVEAHDAPLVDVPQIWGVIDKAGIDDVAPPSATNGGALTFRLSVDQGAEPYRRYYGFVPGGVLVDTVDNRVYRIVRADIVEGRAVIRAELLNGRFPDGALTDFGRTDVDGDDVAPVGFSANTGYFFVGNGAIVMPAFHYVGDFTSASSTVASVSRMDGALGNQLDTHIKAGDSLWFDSANDAVVAYAWAKLGSVTNGTPASMVMTYQAFRTDSRKPLSFIVSKDIADVNKPLP